MSSNLLEIAKSGIFSSRKSLKTTGHNISNVNTEGFSRQRAIQHTSRPIGSGNIVMGTGSTIKKVERMHSEFVERRLNNAISDEHYFQARQEHLELVEQIFNELNNEGFTNILNKFFNSFKKLSAGPENETLRALVRENAKNLIRDFRLLRKSLNDSVDNIDREMDEAAYDINSLLKSIVKYNIKIRELEAMHGETGDLRDDRDLAVRKLSEYFEVKTYRDEANRYVVFAVGLGTVVSGDSSLELKSTSPPADKGQHHLFPGSREIYIGNRIVSSKFKNGKISALFKTRNEEILTLQNKVDESAYHIAKSVNAIHRRGHGLNKSLLNSQLKTSQNDYTGNNFFVEPKEVFRAAEYLQINEDIVADLNKIATALRPNSPGDNRVALAISKLQNALIGGDLTRTLEEDYLQAIGSLTLASNKARVNAEQSQGITAQTKALKERISGVSLDEESSNMVRFQQAYSASARVMQVADDMIKEILNIKR